MFRESVILVSLFAFSAANASPLGTYQDFREVVRKLQANIQEENLTLATLTRPENCPIAGPTFREIADKMIAVSSSLSDSKCYEKHSKVIHEISQASKVQAEAEFDFSPGENGAFVESDSKTKITITNNQYQSQSIQNSNTLISGLLEVSKDKECVDSLRKSGHLTTIAQTLSRFGTMGLVLPSSIGMMGSAVILATAGSLYVLDKIIQPKFSWKFAKDRNDFMALTCAFYNLRTQLHEADFFEVTPKNVDVMLARAEKYLAEVSKYQSQNEKIYEEWTREKNSTLEKFLEKKLQFRGEEEEKRIALYLGLEESIALLKSKTALGRNPEDRYTIRNFFLNHLSKYEGLLSTAHCTLEFGNKIKEDLGNFISLSETKLLELTARQWMGRMTSYENLFRDLIRTNLPEIVQAVEEFKLQTHFEEKSSNGGVDLKMAQNYSEMKSLIAKLQRDLTIKFSNLKRMQSEKSLSSFDEGAQSEFDIRTEYSNIRNLILGKKGWKFVRYLIEDAGKSIEKYKSDYKKWNSSRDRAADKTWVCRDAKELADLWGTANEAVELAYGFLGANNDLWTTFHPHFNTFLKVPYRRSDYRKLYKAVKSSELAKVYLGLPESRKKERILERIENFHSTFARKPGTLLLQHLNLGATIVQVKDEAKSLEEIRQFRSDHCGVSFVNK